MPVQALENPNLDTMRFIWVCVLWMLGSMLPAQVLLHEREIERFENDTEDMYPYFTWVRAPLEPILSHEPTLNLDDGSFVMVWKPERFSSRLHYLSHYNLLLEESWTIDLKLERAEDMLGMMQSGDSLSIITHEYEFLSRNHVILARTVSLEDGTMTPPRVLQTIAGRGADQLFYTFSPNRKLLAIYTFMHSNPLRRPTTEFTHINRYQQLGYRVFNAETALLAVYDAALQKVVRTTLPVPNVKHSLLGEALDDQGNFYLYLYERKNTLKVLCRQFRSGELRTLTYNEEVADLFDLEEGYAGQLPPSLGQDNKVLWALAERVKRGKKRGIQSFRIVVFDFAEMAVDDLREVPVNSTLRVAVEKQRELYNLPSMRRFDEYRAQEVVEMPNGEMWLLVQKHEYVRMDPQSGAYSARSRIEDRIEEMVLFHFNAEGNIQQASIAPSAQLVRSFYDRLGAFYSMQIDTANEVMHLLTREAGGEKMRDPDRLYYRYLDMKTGFVSPRVQVYENEARRQFWLKGYTTWLRPGIVSTLIMERGPGPVQLISLNLAAPREEEEDAPR